MSAYFTVYVYVCVPLTSSPYMSVLLFVCDIICLSIFLSMSISVIICRSLSLSVSFCVCRLCPLVFPLSASLFMLLIRSQTGEGGVDLIQIESHLI